MIFDAGGCAIYYDTTGCGDALIYLHGGFGGLGTGPVVPDPEWRDDFSTRYRVITFDRRSSGRSATSAHLHTLTEFAADVRALLDHLEVPRAAVWGHSAGGAIALTFAREHPDRTRALVVTDAAPWFSRDKNMLDRLRKRVALLERDGAEAAYLTRKTDGPVGLQLFDTDPATSADQRLAQLRTDVERSLRAVTRAERIAMYAAELRTYAAYIDFDARPWLPRIATPAFVAFGTTDRIFPDQDWTEVARTMPAVTVLPVPGGGHGATRRPEVIEAVNRFLSANLA